MEKDLETNLFNDTQRDILKKMLDEDWVIEGNTLYKNSALGDTISNHNLKFLKDYGLLKSIGKFKFTLHPKKLNLIKKIISNI